MLMFLMHMHLGSERSQKSKGGQEGNEKFPVETSNPSTTNFQVDLALVGALAWDRHSTQQNKGDLNDSEEV